MIEQQPKFKSTKPKKPLPEEFARDPILGTAQTAEAIGTSTVHLRRLSKMGKFPAPIKIGYRKLGWRLSTINRHLAECERIANPHFNTKSA